MRTGVSSRIFFILIATISSAFSQIRLSPGVNIGTPLTDTLVSSSYSASSGASSSFGRYHSATKRLLVGPALRLELPRGLGLEFDALYQRVNYDYASGSQTASTFSIRSFEQASANRWQFPFLLQYSGTMGKITPFIEGGPSISAIVGGASTFTTTTQNLPPSTSSTNTYTRTLPALTTAGVTMGGGVAIPALGHRLRAEIRFSHWFRTTATGYPVAIERSGDFSATLGAIPIISQVPLVQPVSGGFLAHSNEASFLLGFFF